MQRAASDGHGFAKRARVMPTARAVLAIVTVSLVGAVVAAPARGQVTQPGTLTEFPVPANSQPLGITQGPDGAMWVTGFDADKVFRMTTDGQITNTFPTSGDALNQPNFITVGPDGNLWLTEDDDQGTGGNAVARLTPSGVSTVFPLPHALSSAEGIVAGPDGRLWFTEFGSGGNRIGSIDPSAPNPGTTIQEYTLTGTGPFGITVGPDKLIWFTEDLGNAIGHLNPMAANVQASLVEIPLPAGQTNPTGIVTGPDGQLWFTLQGSGRIGTISTAGVIGGFNLPAGIPHDPTGIALGPDGALWFAIGQQNDAAIGRITTTGDISSRALPVPASDPFVINPGPNATLWFTEIALGASGDRVGRISDILSPPTPAPGPLVVAPRFTG
jgi:virginiamycin B lyase